MFEAEGAAVEELDDSEEFDFVLVVRSGLAVGSLDRCLTLALEFYLDHSGGFVDGAVGYYDAGYLVPAVEDLALSCMVDVDIERHEEERDYY